LTLGCDWRWMKFAIILGSTHQTLHLPLLKVRQHRTPANKSPVFRNYSINKRSKKEYSTRHLLSLSLLWLCYVMLTVFCMKFVHAYLDLAYLTWPMVSSVKPGIISITPSHPFITLKTPAVHNDAKRAIFSFSKPNWIHILVSHCHPIY
jgi:hypothetical protein